MSVGKILEGMIYPRLCVVCGCTLSLREHLLCTNCIADIPRTGYWLWENNPVASALYGRVPIRQACSLMFFRDGSAYRNLIHLFKYDGRKDIGCFLGEALGRELAASPLYSDVSHLVPVPLYFTKYWKRGYNQAAVAARAMGVVMNRPVVEDILVRKRKGSTQTAKDRVERAMAVSTLYRTRSKSANKMKSDAKLHFLVVDDVFTTGATMEACATVLLEAFPGAAVSVCSLAYVE